MTNAINQELTEFTQGVYAARESALRSLVRQASANGADGIVGVRIEQDTGMHSFRVGSSVGGRGDREGLIITLQVFGTAIRARDGAEQYPVQAAIDLGR
jgi:uncharacterized protein YbjQ (UPF0145 family)